VTTTPGIGTVQVDQAVLDHMSTMCIDTGQSLARGMAQVIDRVETLGGGGMAGTAYHALVGVSGQLDDGMRTILTALYDLAGKISNASQQYGVNDTQASTDLTKAASSFGGAVTSILHG
jgi:ESAT-6 family protein